MVNGFGEYRSRKMEQMLKQGHSVLVIGDECPLGAWDPAICALNPRDIHFLAKAANAVFYRERPDPETSCLFEIIVENNRVFRNPDYKGGSSS